MSKKSRRNRRDVPGFLDLPITGHLGEQKIEHTCDVLRIIGGAFLYIEQDSNYRASLQAMLQNSDAPVIMGLVFEFLCVTSSKSKRFLDLLCSQGNKSLSWWFAASAKRKKNTKMSCHHHEIADLSEIMSRLGNFYISIEFNDLTNTHNSRPTSCLMHISIGPDRRMAFRPR